MFFHSDDIRRQKYKKYISVLTIICLLLPPILITLNLQTSYPLTLNNQ